MRTKVPAALENGRVRSGPWATTPDWGFSGAFHVRAPSGAMLTIGAHPGDGRMLASDGVGSRQVISAPTGWEHVSAEADGRTPTWDEMCWIKSLFWDPEECVIEYHPPASKYVRDNSYRLHLWRPKHAAIPMPSVSVVARGF
jgi:hypothetical protein